MVNRLIKLPVIVWMVFVWAGLFAGIAASSQETDGTSIVVTGRLEILVTDDFNRGISTTLYSLQVDNGPVYELQFSGDPPAYLSTGQRVTVKGHVEGNKLRVDTLEPAPGAAVPAADSDMEKHRP